MILSRYVFCIVLFLFSGVFAHAQSRREKAGQLVYSVKKEFAPDRRVALFDISANKTSDNEVLIEGETNLPSAYNQLIDRLRQLDIAFVDSVRILPSNRIEHPYALASLSVVNMRVKPAHSAEMATQVLLGTPVKILKIERGWSLVQSPDNYIAWAENRALGFMDKTEMEKWKLSDRLIVTADFAHVFAKADKHGKLVSDLVKGDILQYHKLSESYYQVVFPDKRIGFVLEEDAMLYQKWLDSREPTADNILKSAFRMMGTPYLWGGTSFKGVDCSGFTKTAYFLNGIIIPRDASQQVNEGVEVSIRKSGKVDMKTAINNLQKGDLIFFTNDPENVNLPDCRITHVGIYMGGGEFVHSSGLVRINSLLSDADNYSSWHAQTFTKARRMLNAIGERGLRQLAKHPWYE